MDSCSEKMEADLANLNKKVDDQFIRSEKMLASLQLQISHQHSPKVAKNLDHPSTLQVRRPSNSMDLHMLSDSTVAKNL